VPPLPAGSHDRACRSSSRGVSPFRAFSSRGAVPPLGGLCPPGVSLSPFAPHALGPSTRNGPKPIARSRIRSGCFFPGAVAVITPATSECLHRRSRSRPKSSPSPTASPQPTPCPTRPCRRPKSLTVRVSHAAVCPVPGSQVRRACARRPSSPVPDTPRGWPGFLSPAPGAEAPWTRELKPRRSQRLDRSMPGVRGGRSPPRAVHRSGSSQRATRRLAPGRPHAQGAAASRFEPTRQSHNPGRRLVRPTSRSSWAVRCDCRSLRRCPGIPPACRRTEVPRPARVRSGPPVPQPRPLLAAAAPGRKARSPRRVCRGRSFRRLTSIPTTSPCRSTPPLSVPLTRRSCDLDRLAPSTRPDHSPSVRWAPQRPILPATHQPSRLAGLRRSAARVWRCCRFAGSATSTALLHRDSRAETRPPRWLMAAAPSGDVLTQVTAAWLHRSAARPLRPASSPVPRPRSPSRRSRMPKLPVPEQVGPRS
jgi:hypothetical protein